MTSDTTTPQTPRVDVQASAPRVPLRLSTVGVTGTERTLQLGDLTLLATFTCSVELGGAQRGAHMSRFEEAITDVLADLPTGASELDLIAAAVAERVRERQQARRAEVHVHTRLVESRTAPISGLPTWAPVALTAIASASAGGTRRILGVQAQGMTACPCAQELVQDASRERLEGEGFSVAEIERILQAVPGATHNQRGIGTLQIGLPEGSSLTLDASQLVRLVERSMSAEIYELMKRTDEQAVVERAHRRPRFVEDCVREAITSVLEHLPELPAEAWLSAEQKNLETIHCHDVIAARTGLVGELRAELDGTLQGEPSHPSQEAWLAELS